mmetsp:Transcript_81201/g.99511  ORF Transcript_81201/g.99511 Transcript_81201/m.99511 type:complete len:241 (-) Transcript_81201:1033-1755(-)
MTRTKFFGVFCMHSFKTPMRRDPVMRSSQSSKSVLCDSCWQGIRSICTLEKCVVGGSSNGVGSQGNFIVSPHHHGISLDIASTEGRSEAFLIDGISSQHWPLQNGYHELWLPQAVINCIQVHGHFFKRLTKLIRILIVGKESQIHLQNGTSIHHCGENHLHQGIFCHGPVQPIDQVLALQYGLQHTISSLRFEPLHGFVPQENLVVKVEKISGGEHGGNLSEGISCSTPRRLNFPTFLFG